MRFNQVLVVYKQLPPKTASSKGVTGGQTLHLKTLDILYPLLRRLGIPFNTCSARQVRTISNVDLVITVGGDGTVLRTSHFVGNQPILGIKSFGRESIGYFCAATTDTMHLYLKSLLKGHHRPRKLNRLEILIDGRPATELALNDVLFAHAMPASTCRYRLSIGKRAEEQRSSGIWVCSAAGSTAAVLAAGGLPLPLGAKKIEYVVREPYAPSRPYQFLKGVIPGGSQVKIESLSKGGTVCIDGSHIQYPAPSGTRITIHSSKKPLKIFWKK